MAYKYMLYVGLVQSMVIKQMFLFKLSIIIFDEKGRVAH